MEEKMVTELDRRLVSVTPSKRQFLHQQLEFYAFVHFTVNTYTGREWGDGTENENIFNPTEFDARQWVKAVKSAGMTALMLTCKHHDGFCLWQTKTTSHSVARSPFRDGKGDIVKEVSDACREEGIKFGVYCSPWDRNSVYYGKGKEYDDFFIAQLTELLTGYGDICSVWFDGACGEGPNGKKQVYDWERYYELIRKLQPDACIHVCGPDVRWCGNEAGHTRPSEWSVVPKRTTETELIADRSQHEDDSSFRERKIAAWDVDLGSREVLKDERELVWYPAEVNTSIRPGWFYHDFEDDKVKSVDELLNVYVNSVGGNATFLLNIPPMPNGLFHQNDVNRLAEIGSCIRKMFACNRLESAKLSSDSFEPGHEIENVREDDYKSYFKTCDGVTGCEITVSFESPQEISCVVMKENILMSQRIEAFEIYADTGLVYSGTVVGYKKIARFPAVKTKTLRIKITDSRVCPTLCFIGAY